MLTQISSRTAILRQTMETGYARHLCLLLLSAFVLYIAVLDRTASWNDSLVYLVGAKSIAEGQGYRLINIPPPSPVPTYPPLLSAAISLIWRVAPEYPNNLPLIKLISVFSAILLAIVSAAILRSGDRPPSLMIASVAMLLLHTDVVQMVGATVFSDLPFAAITLFGLYKLDSAIKEKRPGWNMLFLGIAIAASILTRALGVALLIVALGYLFICSKALVKSAIVIVIGCAALSWFIFASPTGNTPPKHIWFYGGLTPYSHQYLYVKDIDSGVRRRTLTEIAALLLRQGKRNIEYTISKGLAIGRAGFGFEFLNQFASGKSSVFLWGTIISGIIFAAVTLTGLCLDWRLHRSPLHVFILVYYILTATAPNDPVFLPRYLLIFSIIFNYFFLYGAVRMMTFAWDKLSSESASTSQESRLRFAQAAAVAIAILLITDVTR